MPESITAPAKNTFPAYGVWLYTEKSREIKQLKKERSPSAHGDKHWDSSYVLMDYFTHKPLKKKSRVLDVGCGNGYHMWRMLGEGAEFVVGVDPSQLFLCQFETIRHFANNNQNVHLLPLGIQELPELKAFDTVFSMGVLYHRKSPIDHKSRQPELLYRPL